MGIFQADRASFGYKSLTDSAFAILKIKNKNKKKKKDADGVRLGADR